ncbi:GcrA cell cycle regulator [Rhizobium sp. BK196]|uniref:GcrA family cell cycle regulator n=1 Tax=Rhizobium sp. BK196 TaxID=2587073 RepID=UPI00161E3627|nr:GcrA family cell cycle regulator [Rhizobium sp. BK196]MBB3313661.1 GcrA cell cycle regulator [Rhizobium sp. BK196]
MSSWQLLKIEQKLEAIREAYPKCTGTAATIARKLFELHGHKVSRNAVIGYYARHGEKLKDIPLRGPHAGAAVKKPLMRAPRQPKPKDNPVMVAEVVKFMEAPKPVSFDDVYRPNPKNLSLLDLEWNDCRYAVSGEKEHTLFCGNTTDRDSSYCPYHHKLCHGPGTKSERLVDHLIRKVA